MQNQNTSARTAAKYGSKSSLLFRQPCFLAMLLLCAVFCQAQLKLIGNPSPIPKDTVKCYFLEITDTSNTTTKWSKGYVARNSEMISFGKTQVSANYLPITSGIVTSELFYEDRKKVVNQCLQVVLVK